jgi:hypothetical protein
MTMYRLKKGQESFQVMSGPMAGKTFNRGKMYEMISEQEAHRFELIEHKKPQDRQTSDDTNVDPWERSLASVFPVITDKETKDERLSSE